MSKPWRLPLRRVNREAAPWAYRYPAKWLVRAILPVFVRRDWRGQEHIPQQGGAILVINHVSNADPIIVAEYIVYSGRWPRFLGKAEIWKWPLMGWIARTTDQIPVFRDSGHAKDSLRAARAALAEGKVVAIYPEGTITTDPDLWPMKGRRGAAQLALETGVPVVPIAQWGAQQILGARDIEWRRLFGVRRHVQIEAGPAVDLSEYRARLPASGDAPKELLDEATEHLMAVLTRMVADLRGEEPPTGRWDMRAGVRVDSRLH
ncbi:MAG: lysophospholipid acyltransferase family protein [Propionibacteriaceae bacterium]|nr:lysophospholipid acyltransferase family protein [Propionibacteriaceae bacterium]